MVFMFVEHTLLTELQPQLQNYLPHEKGNKSRLTVQIPTVGSSHPSLIPASHPIQRSRKHTYSFMDHFSTALEDLLSVCIMLLPPGALLLESLDIPSQAIPHGGSLLLLWFLVVCSCPHRSFWEYICSRISFLTSPQSAGTALPIFVFCIPVAQCMLTMLMMSKEQFKQMS